MVEGADNMDFLGVLRKEEVELTKNLCNSEEIQKDQVGLNLAVAARAAEAKDNSKNASRSDGSVKNCVFEKGSFSSQLRDGLIFKQHGEFEKGLPPWIKTVSGVAKRSSAECIPRPLDLSAVGKCSTSINLFPSQSGFGSPIGFKGGFDHRTWSDDDEAGSSGLVTTFSPTRSGAQLTIFYGGTVNVYEDIPTDKAQAILLIAGGGNYSGYPIIPVAPKGRESQITELKTLLGNSNIPLATKYSLQRFLEKRKGRLNANAKSPYSEAAAADYTNPPSSWAIPLD